MKNSFLLINIILLLIISNKLISQNNNDTILLVNGDVFITNIIDTTKGVVSYKNPKAGKKDITIDNDRIFAIRNAKGENIYYKYDTNEIQSIRDLFLI